MTAAALGAAFERLDTRHKRHILASSSVELCIFLEQDFERYASALRGTQQARQRHTTLPVYKDTLQDARGTIHSLREDTQSLRHSLAVMSDSMEQMRKDREILASKLGNLSSGQATPV